MIETTQVQPPATVAPTGPPLVTLGCFGMVCVICHTLLLLHGIDPPACLSILSSSAMTGLLLALGVPVPVLTRRDGTPR